jgi:hypothetical protein
MSSAWMALDDRFPAINVPTREQRLGALRRWGYLLEK